MTLTDDQRPVRTAEVIGGDAAHRGLITDVNAWLDGLDGVSVRHCAPSASC